jgi:hypothetical protein
MSSSYSDSEQGYNASAVAQGKPGAALPAAGLAGPSQDSTATDGGRPFDEWASASSALVYSVIDEGSDGDHPYDLSTQLQDEPPSQLYNDDSLFSPQAAAHGSGWPAREGSKDDFGSVINVETLDAEASAQSLPVSLGVLCGLSATA